VPFKALCGALGALLGPLGSLLGRSWSAPGRSGSAFGRSRELLGATWAILGDFWALLGQEKCPKSDIRLLDKVMFVLIFKLFRENLHFLKNLEMLCKNLPKWVPGPHEQAKTESGDSCFIKILNF